MTNKEKIDSNPDSRASQVLIDSNAPKTVDEIKSETSVEEAIK